MALAARNIDLHLAGFDLLRDITMSVNAGQITAIVGPNGAGKSSLLRVITGDIQPTRGLVELNGRTIETWPPQQRARMLSVLPQTMPLNFPFTAREVVGLARIPHQTGKIQDEKIVSAAISAVDADYLEKRLYTQMSGGEKQRVQLARVLAQVWGPINGSERFLVLDEPTAAFDLAHQQMMLDIVRRTSQEGIGVLMVLHDLNLAAKCADNLVVLDCGAIAAQGTPGEVLTPELVKQVFQVDAMIQTHPLTGTPMVIA